MTDNTNKSNGEILIVDDNPINLDLLSGLLREHNYRVRAAINGRRALTAIRSCLPDLVMLDITMPEMDGYEVCRQIKADELTRDIPVIFISALDEVIDKVRAFEIGGVDYVTKPFQFGEVLVRIENQLKISRLQREMERKNLELQQSYMQLERANRMLKALSYLDALTGIANRRHFDEALDQEWRRATRTAAPLSLVMIDIDFFKAFNDFYGHQGGDELPDRPLNHTLRDQCQKPGINQTLFHSIDLSKISHPREDHQIFHARCQRSSPSSLTTS